MAATPYPTFLYSPTLASESQALPAVGRVRIHPHSCPGSAGKTEPSSAADKFQEIFSKCIDQSQVNENEPDKDAADAAKKLRKKYMKQSVAMASSYLSQILGLDVSIVDVEMVLKAKEIVDSDGCVAACFLDAGCQYIVVEVPTNDPSGPSALDSVLEAIEVTRLPKQRLILHFEGVDVLNSSSSRGSDIASRVGTISVHMSSSDVPQPPSCKSLIEEIAGWEMDDKKTKKDRIQVIVQLSCTSTNDRSDSDQIQPIDVATTVGALSKSMGEAVGSISLIDPTAEQLGLSYAACMKTDRADGLFTTVVCTRSGEALGLVYSSKESVVAALQCGRGVYYSRSRNGLWRKGDTSGHYQTLHRLDVDCDGDALRFTVTQCGEGASAAFCHLNTLTCWGEPRGLRHLEGTLKQRLVDAPAGSYTKRLFEDDTLLRDKLVEEAQELSEADSKQHVAEELADVLYFAMVRAAKAGVSIDDAVMELDRRSRKVTRRKGDSKTFRIQAGEEILKKGRD